MEEENTLNGMGDAALIGSMASAIGDARMVDEEHAPYAVVPHGYVLRDLSGMRDAPRRRKQVVAFTAPQSLVAYVNRFKGPETTGYADYQDPFRPSLSVTIDHSGPSTPQWGEHKAVLKLEPSHELTAVQSILCKWLDQEDFAEWLMDNAGLVASPVSSELLEMARDLEEHKSVKFRSRVSLADGGRAYSFDDTEKTTNIVVPAVVRFSVEPFTRPSGQVPIGTRLSYRTTDGELRFRLTPEIPIAETLRLHAEELFESFIAEQAGIPIYA